MAFGVLAGIIGENVEEAWVGTIPRTNGFEIDRLRKGVYGFLDADGDTPVLLNAAGGIAIEVDAAGRIDKIAFLGSGGVGDPSWPPTLRFDRKGRPTRGCGSPSRPA
jgi:hypothetical protein